MKLLLCSTFIPSSYKDNLLEFVGKKKISDVSFLLIENAADVYEEKSKGFVYDARANFEKLGIRFNLCDLQRFSGNTKQLLDTFSQYDIVWFGGGNTYYLNYMLHKFDFKKLQNFFKNTYSGVAGGGSAGAIIFCKSIDGYNVIDSQDLAPKIYLDGLDCTDFQVIPHWNNEKYQKKLLEIQSFFHKNGLRSEAIEDSQAIQVYNDEQIFIS